MTKDKGFDFESVGLAKVLSSNVLKIPPHQRDYAWTGDQVNRLFTDLAAAKEKRHDYFLGTIVAIKDKDKGTGPLQVVDGQQRLTTTYLLICAMRDKLRAISKGDTIVKNIENVILTIPDRKEGDKPRLTMNTDDDAFFKELTKPNSKLSELRPTRDSHDLLIESVKAARKWVGQISAVVSDSDVPDVIDSWLDYLENEAQVVLLKASDGARAFKMFETLNDRGLRTSKADLVKSFLFGESNNEIDQAQVCWSSMLENLRELDDDERSLTFLRHHLIATRKFVRADDVYEVIQNEIRGSSESIKFLNELKTYSARYTATFHHDSEEWAKHPTETKRAIEAFNKFDLKPIRPLFYAVSLKFNKASFRTATKLLHSISVRLILASQTRTGSNEQAFSNAARAVYQGEITTTKDLKKALKAVLINDSEFIQVFSVAKASNAGLARYYLRTLEGVANDESEPQFIVNEDEMAVTLEHIFPKTPKDGTWSEFSDDERRIFKTRIGNLCLLQKKPNNQMDNSTFAAKKAIFEKSKFVLTANIAEISKWSPKAIEKRQLELAQFAAKAWPL
ncbi:DUF262 domain-containing protein [Sulfitobacter dubius]|uniref:DUF262 domain-containing protein n=1 Tax=Sulfitobacter dubius TaxID=218673 RepID=UPI0022AE8536|nr:DUF262 domain-containing HNH endonuclease family protein [Sulfitobacter dubius]MCZ4368256.1 DUF262 domain-containing HNH endonuclease family protein [Sulfitobacter dubius]